MVEFLITQHRFHPEQLASGACSSPLMIAAQNGATDIVKYLVERHHVDVTVKDKNRDDAFIFAIKCKHFETAAYLLTTRKFNLAEKHKRTGLNYFGYAVSKGQFGLALLMLKQLKEWHQTSQLVQIVNADVKRRAPDGLGKIKNSLMDLCFQKRFYPGMLFLADECNIELPVEYIQEHEESD